MRIGDCIPFQAFRAYGLPAPARPASAPVRGAAPVASPPHVAQLVGARVTAPAGLSAALDAAPVARPAPDAISYPMYTRAADRVEAAVAVQLGRAVDVRG